MQVAKQKAKTTLLYTGVPVIAFSLFSLVLWECLVRAFAVPMYLVPPPTTIFQEIWDKQPSLFIDTCITMLEALSGFAIANVMGIMLAIVFVHSRLFEKMVYPYVRAFTAVPLVAIAPLLVLWFGNGMLGKIVMAAVICFFPIIVNATIGMKSVDPEAMDLMKSLSSGRLQILLKLRLPSALPYIFSALKISSTLSVVGAIVAELSGATMGIGYIIMIASYQVQTPTLFAAIIAASLGGMSFFGLVSLAEKRYLRWHDSAVHG